MTGQQLAQEAAIRGVSVPRLVRDKVQSDYRSSLASAGVWRRMPLDVRCLLITTSAPDREDIMNAAAMSWEAFTEGEQTRMGAAARAIAAGLREAGGLR